MSPSLTKTDIRTSEEELREAEGSELKPAQWNVLQALAAGRTVLRAAEAGGVSERTVFRWLRDDASFKAAYARLRSEQQLNIAANLELIAHAAANCVERSLSGGNPRIALALLKGLGYLPGRATQPIASAEGRGDSRKLSVLLHQIAGGLGGEG